MDKKITAITLAEKIKKKEITVKTAVEQSIKLIKEDKSNCFISFNEECALKQAEAVQADIDSGKLTSPFAGVPVAIDDNILIKDELCTAGSKMLYNFKPPFGATVVERIINAGMIIVGKTNINELGFGDSTDYSFKGATKNPVDQQKVSSGAAAAVASGIIPLAFGSDIMGESRRLAAQAGVCFIKPTYGTVSRFGLIANTSSMEQIGVTAASVEDGYTALSVISGYDPKDGTSYKNESYEYKEAEIRKIGVIKELCGDCEKIVKGLENQGFTVEYIDFPLYKYISAVSHIISYGESSNNITRFDGIKFGYRTENFRGVNDLYLNSRTEAFGIEAKKAAMMGAYVLSQGQYEPFYNQSMKIRGLMKQNIEKAFESYDVIITSAYQGEAYGLGETMKDCKPTFENTKYTALANLTGSPATAVPYKNGGINIIAKQFDESKIYTLAKKFEQEGAL